MKPITETVTLINALGLKYNSVGDATNIKPSSWANKMQGREKFTLTQQLAINLHLLELKEKLNSYFAQEAQPELSFSETPAAPQEMEIAVAAPLQLSPAMQKELEGGEAWPTFTPEEQAAIDLSNLEF